MDEQQAGEGAPLSRARFETGMHWDAYVAQMTVNQSLVRELYRDAEVAQAWARIFEAVVARHGGRLAVSVLTEDWCGDAVMVLPLLARLVGAVAGMELRLFLRDQQPEIAAAYEAEGVTALPVLSFFDAAWQEVARWDEKAAAAAAPKAAYLDEFPELPALRAAGTPEAWARLEEIFGGLIPRMATWYREGLWDATLVEWATLFEARG